MNPQEKEAIQTILDTFPGAQVLSPQAIADEVATWGEAKREAYEERAAIVEEGEKCSRAAAENLAYAMQEKKGKSMAIINERMSAAKAYAQRGWPVLPIVPGEKSPLVSGGYMAATINPAKIQEWWERWPDAGVGIATGIPAGCDTGLIVVDVDKKNGGDVTMREHTQKHGRPYTLMAKTPSGGWHIYFSTPKDTVINSSSSVFGPGVDVRCERGHIVAPPTPGYSWLLTQEKHSTALDMAVAATSAKIEALPLHMLARLREGGGEEHTGEGRRDWSSTAGQDIGEGRRDDTMASVVGAIVGGCRNEAMVEDIAMAWNKWRCKPPLPQKDIARIVKSIISKHNRSNP
jgi:hypothetical protein